MGSVVVFGGYGTFGSHVARELARLGVPLVIAGRDRSRAQAFARALGAGHRGRAADVTRPESCREALRGQTVAVNCAGPFGQLGTALLDACLESGCHYADIADDRRYAALVRAYGGRFQERGLAAIYGCSSLPGLSGALGLLALGGSPATPERARVTLFIGNNNPKGEAAIRSLVGGLGKPIAAPQGTRYGFRDREVVPLPRPFGRRAVFNFESPEYDLFGPLLGVRSVVVKVGFELQPAAYAFALLAVLGWNYGPRTADLLARPAGLLRRLGTSGGAVMTELFYPDGSTRRAALVGRRDGQRMAALPCAYVARALAEGRPLRSGMGTVYDLLGAGPLLDRLTAAGFELHTTPAA
jgi:hypothetical protein